MLVRPHDRAPLFGRASEIEVLTRLLDGLEQDGVALVLAGEPGIEKSRLLSRRGSGTSEKGRREDVSLPATRAIRKISLPT